MMEFTETWKEALEKWKKGDPVWTADLGGMGPGYEQAIQVLLFKILENWVDGTELDNDEAYSKEYEAVVDKSVGELRGWGFSGGQVGAAKSTAYQFLKFGYAEMMNKLPEDRKILVSDNLRPK